MKVAQIIPCLGTKSGGPSRSVYELTKGLRSIGVDSEILTCNYLENPNIASDSWIHSVDVKKVRPFEYYPQFKSLLSPRYDLFHIQSIYSYSVTIAARYARKHKIPYVIAPRGSLYGAAMNSSSYWKKQIFNRIFLFNDLNNASAIHVTCQEELEQVRRLGIRAPIAIIPNSISLPERLPEIQTTSVFRLCFLGRINPIKNLDSVLKAWHLAGMAQRQDAELVIIGDAKLDREKEYLNELHEIEKSLQIVNIVWKGNVTGETKDALLNSCSYLILPSFSENFGMVVVEALVQGVPVVASKGTPWKILESERCGWWIENGVDSIKEQIIHLLDISEATRQEMGRRGQLCVKEHFSTPAISQSLRDLYFWILEGTNKPDFVYM